MSGGPEGWFLGDREARILIAALFALQTIILLGTFLWA